MEEKELIERITETEARAKSNTKRLDKLEEVTENIHKIAETLVEITAEMRHNTERVAEIKEEIGEVKDKVDAMEREPAKKWKDSTKAIFNAFLGAVGTAAAGGVLWMITQTIK